jgi:hypothetical protein
MKRWILGLGRPTVALLDVPKRSRTALIEEHLLYLGNLVAFLQTAQYVQVGQMPALKLNLLHGNADFLDLPDQ